MPDDKRPSVDPENLDLERDAGYLALGKFKNWRYHFPAFDLNGDPEAKAQKLTAHIERLRSRGIEVGKPNETQTRLMALELVCYYQSCGATLPSAVLRLLSAALGFDPSAMPDPREHYVNAPERAKTRNKRDFAERLEANHLADHGCWAPVNAIANKAGVSRATIRDVWRRDPEYLDTVRFLADRPPGQS